MSHIVIEEVPSTTRSKRVKSADEIDWHAVETGLAGILLILTTLPIMVVIPGITLWILWDWFITPVTGLPRPSIPMVMGFSIAIRMITGGRGAPTSPERQALLKSDPLKYWWLETKQPVTWAIFVIACGWILVNWPNFHVSIG